MTTHLIGQLMEVKPIETEDRKTGKIKYSTDITVLFEGIDEDGYKKITAETVNIDPEYLDILRDKIGKTISIPYTARISQYGINFYPDKTMPVLVLEKNPLDYSSFKRDAVKKG